MSHNGTAPNELNGGQVTAESAGTPDPEVVAKAERRHFTALVRGRKLMPSAVGALTRRMVGMRS